MINPAKQAARRRAYVNANVVAPAQHLAGKGGTRAAHDQSGKWPRNHPSASEQQILEW